MVCTQNKIVLPEINMPVCFTYWHLSEGKYFTQNFIINTGSPYTATIINLGCI
jgi:hypothetical protein